MLFTGSVLQVFSTNDTEPVNAYPVSVVVINVPYVAASAPVGPA